MSQNCDSLGIGNGLTLVPPASPENEYGLRGRRQSGKSRRHTLGFDLFGAGAVAAVRSQETTSHFYDDHAVGHGVKVIKAHKDGTTNRTAATEAASPSPPAAQGQALLQGAPMVSGKFDVLYTVIPSAVKIFKHF